jgi:type I restriction enzyme S subunit
MVAVTCSGTIGKVNIIPKHWENWTMSQHVMRIVAKKYDIAGFLYIWLNSEYGRLLIERNTYGAVVDEIDASHLSSVPVPILKDREIMKKIGNLALEANKLRYEAYCFEQEAIMQMNKDVIFRIKK